MAKEKHKEIEKAIEVIDQMSMDPKEWEIYESRRRAEILYDWDIAAAKEEGKEERYKRAEKKNGMKERDWKTEKKNGIEERKGSEKNRNSKKIVGFKCRDRKNKRGDGIGRRRNRKVKVI